MVYTWQVLVIHLAESADYRREQSVVNATSSILYRAVTPWLAPDANQTAGLPPKARGNDAVRCAARRPSHYKRTTYSLTVPYRALTTS